jgi:hypothetical protein
MLSYRQRLKLFEFWTASRPWILGGVGAVLLVGIWILLATSGPGRAVTEVPKDTISPTDPVLLKKIAAVAELEAHYNTFAAADIVSDEALAVLAEAVAKQREIARSAVHGDYAQQQNLERLESEFDSLRARRALGTIEQRVKDGDEDVKALRLVEAEAAYKEALQLQRAINTGAAPSRFKNYVREAEIEKSLTSLQVYPLNQEKDRALEKARAAMAEERWADALAGYTAARDAFDRINREFGATRFADLAGLDRIEAEIATLNAASIVKELDAKEAEGDAADRAGDTKAAAAFYLEALTRQQQVNQLFARSRFVSSKRIETLETKLQTARSQPIAVELTRLDATISADLRRRRLVAAEQALPRALELTERLEKDFPRSRYVDGAMRIKLSYLGLKRAEIKALQDQVFDRLLPLIGVNDRLMLASEVPQDIYQTVMNTNPSRNPGRGMPVDSVNWNDAQEFCTRLGWIMGTKVRLPTEAEYRGALGANPGEVRSSAGEGKVGTTVGGRANPNGYRDLVGNLAEWLNADAALDRATLAGGSNLDSPEALAKFILESRSKVDRARHIGFRVVMELPADR